MKSFAELGKHFGIKPKAAKQEERKCPKCGQALTNHAGTNVWSCGWSELVEKKIGNKVVQVFYPCKTTILGS